MKKLLFLLLFCSFSFVHADERSDRLQQHVKYLASEELEGRAPGKKGNVLAAEYIKDQFKKIGLIPYGSSSYFQEFPIITDIQMNGKGNELSIVTGNKEHILNSFPFPFR